MFKYFLNLDPILISPEGITYSDNTNTLKILEKSDEKGDSKFYLLGSATLTGFPYGNPDTQETYEEILKTDIVFQSSEVDKVLLIMYFIVFLIYIMNYKYL